MPGAARGALRFHDEFLISPSEGAGPRDPRPHPTRPPGRDRVRKMPSPTSTGVVKNQSGSNTVKNGGKRIPVMLMST